MYCFKRSSGGNFCSKKLAYQRVELYAKPLAMNKMTKRRMPKGH
ncbi:hypothetical protein NEOC65_000427 [Neochlamydia sp. AcF65]|nr:hypothetical protein [Neochlamydia sp. AcF65]